MSCFGIQKAGAWVGLQVGDGGMVVDAMPLISLQNTGDGWKKLVELFMSRLDSRTLG